METKVHAGARFVHARQLDPNWAPGPGQRYMDAPKRVMVVTRVARGTVYYRPDDGGTRGAFCEAITSLDSVVGEWL